MQLLRSIIDLFLHIDVHLQDVIAQYGSITYAILFAIIFCETGLVVTPFLPGDSLLFAAGAFAAIGSLNPFALLAVVWVAAVLGDTTNYHIGKFVGPKVFKEKRPFLNQQKLLMAEKFYEVHGGKAIVFARFIPVMRTLAPFVAGVGKMQYTKFLYYNLLGATIWVFLFVGAGHFFGNISFVRDHFTAAIMAIIVLSLMPGLFHWIKSKLEKRSQNV